MDIANLMTYPYKTLRLDSGFRRRDEFEAPSLLVIPAKAGIQGYKRRVWCLHRYGLVSESFVGPFFIISYNEKGLLSNSIYHDCRKTEELNLFWGAEQREGGRVVGGLRSENWGKQVAGGFAERRMSCMEKIWDLWEKFFHFTLPQESNFFKKINHNRVSWASFSWHSNCFLSYWASPE